MLTTAMEPGLPGYTQRCIYTHFAVQKPAPGLHLSCSHLPLCSTAARYALHHISRRPGTWPKPMTSMQIARVTTTCVY